MNRAVERERETIRVSRSERIAAHRYNRIPGKLISMRASQVERSIESTGSPDRRRITSETSCSRLHRRPPSSLPARRYGVYTHHTCGPPP